MGYALLVLAVLFVFFLIYRRRIDAWFDSSRSVETGATPERKSSSNQEGHVGAGSRLEMSERDKALLHSPRTSWTFVKVTLTICAIVSTLCLLYFVLVNELSGCLVYPESKFCTFVMDLLPDDPETTVTKRVKSEDDPPSVGDGYSKAARDSLKTIIERPPRR